MMTAFAATVFSSAALHVSDLYFALAGHHGNDRGARLHAVCKCSAARISANLFVIAPSPPGQV